MRPARMRTTCDSPVPGAQPCSATACGRRAPGRARTTTPRSSSPTSRASRSSSTPARRGSTSSRTSGPSHRSSDSVMFYGRDAEPPRERRQLKRIPRVLAASFRLVWEAAPGRFLLSLAPQAVAAVVTGAQLVVTRDLIAAVLATQSGGDLGRVGTLLAYTIGLTVAGAAANLVQGQQQQLLGAIVERHTNSVLLDRIIAVDLKRFETPDFQDLLRRAMNAMGRMMGVTGAAIGLVRGVALIIGVAAALYVLQPVRLLIAVIGFVPMWLASMATSRTMYRFFRSMTPNERMRSYVFNLFTQREYAKEIRAFGLAGYLRSLYERLSNVRLEELRKNLGKRARY